jgi:hypothetical protein
MNNTLFLFQFRKAVGALRSFSLSGTLRYAPLETYTSSLALRGRCSNSQTYPNSRIPSF